MTCYERLRQQRQNIDTYNRLQSYFHALEQNKTDEYHDQHGRKQKNVEEY